MRRIPGETDRITSRNSSAERIEFGVSGRKGVILPVAMLGALRDCLTSAATGGVLRRRLDVSIT